MHTVVKSPQMSGTPHDPIQLEEVTSGLVDRCSFLCLGLRLRLVGNAACFVAALAV